VVLYVIRATYLRPIPKQSAVQTCKRANYKISIPNNKIKI